MRRWRVVGGLLVDDRGLLLVANRRRGGTVDWSTPGGVIDPGETPVEALGREVAEETGYRVDAWDGPRWTVGVEFVDRGDELFVEVHRARTFGGELRLEDPDGIVTDARFLTGAACRECLTGSPRWVAEPLVEFVEDRIGDPVHFAYRVEGIAPGELRVERRS